MPYPYVKTTWVDEDGSGSGTLANAARLNNAEVGIYDATEAAHAAATAAVIDGGSPSTNHAGNLRIDFGSVT